MPKKEISAVERISGYMEKLVQDIETIHPDYPEEKIHHFRTTTKKLRAWLRTGGLEKEVLTKEFKRIYRVAGEIRDAQVLIIRLAGDKQDQPWFLLWLVSYISSKQKVLRKKIKAFNSGDWMSLFLPVKEKWAEADTASFCKIRTQQVYRLKGGAVGDIRIHEIRKLIKDVFYIRHRDSPAIRNNRNEVQLKKTETLLGTYVDICRSIGLLKQYMQSEKDAKRKRQARLLLQSWMRVKQRTKESIIHMLKSRTVPGLPLF